MGKDYYKVLGIEDTADREEIVKAFRALAIKYNPLKNYDELAKVIPFIPSKMQFLTRLFSLIHTI
jgi:DnaJ-class molecular chaperone